MLATPDEGHAATIRREGKITKEECKAPEGKGCPTAVAAQEYLRLAIAQFKALMVAIHTEQRVERDHGACAAKERHST